MFCHRNSSIRYIIINDRRAGKIQRFPTAGICGHNCRTRPQIVYFIAFLLYLAHKYRINKLSKKVQPQIAVAFLGRTRSYAPDASPATREAAEAALWGGTGLTRTGPLGINSRGISGRASPRKREVDTKSPAVTDRTAGEFRTKVFTCCTKPLQKARRAGSRSTRGRCARYRRRRSPRFRR